MTRVPTSPAQAVSGYRIERLIGVGGAAAVYEARRLGDRSRGQGDAVENPEPREGSAPIAEPGPSPPVAPSPATPEQPRVPAQSAETEAPHRATERAAGPYRKRVHVQRETRRLEPAPTLRRPEPLGGEPPPWSRP